MTECALLTIIIDCQYLCFPATAAASVAEHSTTQQQPQAKGVLAHTVSLIPLHPAACKGSTQVQWTGGRRRLECTWVLGLFSSSQHSTWHMRCMPCGWCCHDGNNIWCRCRRVGTSHAGNCCAAPRLRCAVLCCAMLLFLPCSSIFADPHPLVNICKVSQCMRPNHGATNPLVTPSIRPSAPPAACKDNNDHHVLATTSFAASHGS